MFARQSTRGRAPGAVRGGIARDRRSVLFGGARRRRLLVWVILPAVLVGVVAAVVAGAPARADSEPVGARIGPSPPPPTDDGTGTTVTYPAIAWRVSEAIGYPFRGRLVRGVQLPDEGSDWFTWDPVRNRAPDRGWRRWGTDALLRTVLHTLREYRAADPLAPRVGIMDLSRRHGGWFGREYGGLGHASHQNGLDVDVLYPRKDGTERRPFEPAQVDRQRAQALVDLFVDAGAERIFVGPHLHLAGPRKVVTPLIHHDDHLHVRIPPPPA